jgi:hypothetical protein
MSGFGKTTIFNGLLGNRPKKTIPLTELQIKKNSCQTLAVPEMDGRPVAKCD